MTISCMTQIVNLVILIQKVISGTTDPKELSGESGKRLCLLDIFIIF
jgi:hypothetical protein